ncbi:MAG: hypothetical protein LBU58_00170, partial [Clostridiales bacterium]|nr:hypothetical protein [Clostridiales bacterium]
MRYTIVSDLPETANLPGRIRIMVERGTANAAASALGLRSGVLSVSASSVTGSLIVLYKRGARSDVLAAAAGLDTTALEPYTKPELGLDFRKRLYAKIAAHIARRLLLPAWLRIPIDIFHALRFVRAALAALRRGKLNVEVLDGAAIMGAMLQGDFSSASTVMLLLGVSELLEDYTHKKARGALSQSLVLNVDTVWVREDGAERQIPLPQLQIGA